MPISKVSRITVILLGIAVAVALAQPAGPTGKLSKKGLKVLIASAKTPGNHERIAAYYRAEVQQLEAKHREHEEDLAEYYKNPSQYPSKYPTMGDHCRSLASHYKTAAERAAKLAEMHEEPAQAAR